MNRVVSSLELDFSTSQLMSKINVTVPADTRIVSISVQDESAEEAARIVNGVRQAAADKIIEVTKVSDIPRKRPKALEGAASRGGAFLRKNAPPCA